jgi:hypothetical protein
MADKKISALTGATTPLAGTEVLPIVQGGATVNVSVANLTAGRAISATELTLTTGNLIVSNGKGIDFSLTPGTGTSELLADYEEGLHTTVLAPQTSGSFTLTNATLAYTKIGRQVSVIGSIEIGSQSSPIGSSVNITLPFAAANLAQFAGNSSGIVQYNFGNTNLGSDVGESGSVLFIRKDAATFNNGDYLTICLTYFTA